MGRKRRILWAGVAAMVLGAVAVPVARGGPAVPGVAPAAGTEKYGDLEFPRDEHVHPDGWDYWWGAADIATVSGNHYTVSVAFDAVDGVAVDSQEVYPHQGPYKGQTLATPNGGANWGHPGETPNEHFVRTVNPYVPGVTDLLRYETHDVTAGGKLISLWERTSLAEHDYHMLIDDSGADAARVHPTGSTVPMRVELNAHMQKPPLLAGGSGRWWYGNPQAIGYPSRSFQYMQIAQTLTGSLQIGQPDGSLLHEAVDPAGSRLLMIHEYDATPEDLPAGLALTLLTQVHDRYAQYYQGGMPWELLFADLGNGAQLMVAVLAFHDTPQGAATPVYGQKMTQYKVLSTLRLPDGTSVPLDDRLHVEHLAYRTLIGQVPTFDVSITGIWKQAWKYRATFAGGDVAGPNGKVAVPAFDVGFSPQFGVDEPQQDDKGNAQIQRVPFAVTGAYGGCPVHGFAWSEIIVNWYGHEADDPWYTGGALPSTPASCSSTWTPAPAGTRTIPPGASSAPTGVPHPSPDTGCGAYSPGAPTCSFTATTNNGIAGYGAAPGGWRVTITRPGLAAPLVIQSFGGSETYQCGTVRPGDRVAVTTQDGSFVSVGNPGFCF